MRLRREVFDVLIVGGGINGAGIARDLTLRSSAAGIPVALGLIEQRHFGSGTSGRNSQLIHGGLRYLKNLEFGLVRESLRERSILLKIAPELVKPLPFLLPYFSWSDRFYYGAGLWMYDVLAGSRNIGRHQTISRSEVASVEPLMSTKGVIGAGIFYDCQVNSARFLLANVLEAAAHGAVCANYIRADSWTRRDEIWSVAATDTMSGEQFEIRARKLVDTTGPWSRGSTLRLVRGSHIVLPRVNSSSSAVAHFDEQGRIVFIMPWGGSGELSLVGTTDIDHDRGPENVCPSREEVQYLTATVCRLFPAADVKIISAYSSLRPLLPGQSDSPTRASREHRIWNDPDGILRVAGGKYTTYRAMSEEACDLIAAEIAPGLRDLHLTAEAPISIPASDSEGGQIARAVRHEMAQRLADVMFVSTYWGWERRWNSRDLEPLAREMAELLDWDERRITQEIELVLRISEVPDHILH